MALAMRGIPHCRSLTTALPTHARTRVARRSIPRNWALRVLSQAVSRRWAAHLAVLVHPPPVRALGATLADHAATAIEAGAVQLAKGEYDLEFRATDQACETRAAVLADRNHPRVLRRSGWILSIHYLYPHSSAFANQPTRTRYVSVLRIRLRIRSPYTY